MTLNLIYDREHRLAEARQTILEVDRRPRAEVLAACETLEASGDHLDVVRGGMLRRVLVAEQMVELASSAADNFHEAVEGAHEARARFTEAVERTHAIARRMKVAMWLCGVAVALNLAAAALTYWRGL